jgi:CDP-paratose 2-epimerase
MAVAVITGSAGLIGSETVRRFAEEGLEPVGIDNDMRSYFFGPKASTQWCREQLQASVRGYRHAPIDIRDRAAVDSLFADLGRNVSVVVHTAAQPSHDWAAREPMTDFSINALGTMVLLEAVRKHCPDAPFIFTSTNKVYGDTPNRLPLIEKETRWDLDPSHPFYDGIDESMSIDMCKHSLFGVSKVSADIMVQEYGRYFGMKTGVFRGGCLTGGGHSGTELHGFLSYLMYCVITGKRYTIFGYEGNQVRDNIHSRDLVSMFWSFQRNPRCGEVYNAGGSRYSHCSMMEAIALCERIAGKKLHSTYVGEARSGDHQWYVSDVRKFQRDYPEWSYTCGLEDMLVQICEGWRERLASSGG